MRNKTGVVELERVSASIMCADPLNLENELKNLLQSGVNWLHCDVMDGEFVKNLAMAPYNIKPIIETKEFITDIHLACHNPERYIDLFTGMKPDYITFHVEATDNVDFLIDKIKNVDIGVGIAISPSTRLERIIPYIYRVDLILVMTVEPGFAGQSFEWSVLEKLKELNRVVLDYENRPLIVVDGSINKKTIPSISSIGADIYVLGTSALFNDENLTYREKIKTVKSLFKGKEGYK